MKRILLVGDDFALLASRAILLAKTEASITCCNSAEFTAHLHRDQFDLVILCYSLGHAKEEKIAVEVRCRWPEARLLVIAAENGGSRSRAFIADAVTNYMQPAELIRAALPCSRNRRSNLPAPRSAQSCASLAGVRVERRN